MMNHSISSSSIQEMMMKEGEFDHIFNDQELASFLDGIAAGSSHQEPLMETLPLQFLPPDAPTVAPQASACLSDPGSIAEDLTVHSGVNSHVNGHQMKAINLLAQSQGGGGQGGLDLRSFGALLTGAAAPPSMAPPPTSSTASLPLAKPQSICPPSKSVKGDAKPQISHSTVEKQRRDRINGLIDELRELVPPSKATQAAAAGGAGSAKDAGNLEARRPKHVVLADTIALLKQLQLRGPLSSLLAAGPVPPLTAPVAVAGSGLQGGPSQQQQQQQAPLMQVGVKDAQGASVKEEITSCANSRESLSSDMEMKDDTRTAAPKLPCIPIQPTLLAGVVVERGPDCMYVQVRCRDRKGLLLDIINALRQLPLEIRTAAVTTQPDGQVRDVFEVSLDDKALQPEEVQNMVHEALFQQYHLSAEAHKRPRC